MQLCQATRPITKFGTLTKGYGTGLISFARDYAKTIDCYEMFLITNRSNISACKCYEKAGGINDADDEVVYVYDFREEN